MVGSNGRSGGDRTISQCDTSPVDGGPQCPSDLPESVAGKWRSIVEQIPAGALREIDGHQLRILCELLHGADVLAEQVRADCMNDKARRMYLQTCDRVNRLSAQFGLSPMDRRRVNLQPAESEWDEVDKWELGIK